MPKYYYKPILAKIQEAYLANAQKEYDAGFDIESNVRIVIEADTEEQVLEAWQTLVDTGMAWQLQGWFGRTARHLIEEGYINE